MAYNPLNPNGQATMANSQPVVLPSDQSEVPTKDDTLRTAVGTAADFASATGSLHAKLRQLADNTDGLEGFTDGLETLITTLNGYIDQLEGYVDGLEGALTTLNATDFSTSAKQDTLNTAVGTTADVASATGSLHAKLRQIADNTDGLEGFTDGLETLITTLNGYVDQLEGYVDGLEGALTTLNAKDFATSAKQDTLIGHVDGIETALTAIQGYIDGLEGFVDGLETALGTAADVASPTGSMHAKLRQLCDNTDAIAATPYHLVSAASTNATSLKNAAGVVYGIQCSNVNAAARYLKLYNKASAPTVGTDTPVKTLIIPGNAAGAGTNIPISVRGINFSTGIAFALTTEATDAGTTAVAASEIVVNIDYI
jgi:ABC-type transporter Mla subunit MlaD